MALTPPPIAFLFSLIGAVVCALSFFRTAACAWQSDTGDGTFTNPPLYADYPDPDIIRVGDDFYFSTTSVKIAGSCEKP